MRFNGIVATLKCLIPDLKRVFHTASKELLLVKVPYASDAVPVDRSIFVLFLHDQDILRYGLEGVIHNVATAGTIVSSHICVYLFYYSKIKLNLY